GTTDRNGRVATTWTLGVPGAQELRARAPAGPSAIKNGTVRFRATALPGVTPVRLEVRPTQLTLAPGASHQFEAVGLTADGSAVPVSVTWTASGGTITETGLFSAGTAQDTLVVAARTAEGLADTARVIVTSDGTVAAVAVSPPAD